MGRRALRSQSDALSVLQRVADLCRCGCHVTGRPVSTGSDPCVPGRRHDEDARYAVVFSRSHQKHELCFVCFCSFLLKIPESSVQRSSGPVCPSWRPAVLRAAHQLLRWPPGTGGPSRTSAVGWGQTPDSAAPLRRPPASQRPGPRLTVHTVPRLPGRCSGKGPPGLSEPDRGLWSRDQHVTSTDDLE